LTDQKNAWVSRIFGSFYDINNIILNQVYDVGYFVGGTSNNEGLGMLSICFDCAYFNMTTVHPFVYDATPLRWMRDLHVRVSLSSSSVGES
jgi:hypothetical protein